MNISIRRIVYRLVFFVLFVAILVCTVSYRILSKMAYRSAYCEKRRAYIAQERNLLKCVYGARDVRFTTDDGFDIAGLLIVRDEAKRNVLICHGYKQAKEIHSQFVRIFPHDNILFFDFRAHGESCGGLITVGYHEKNDVHAAIAFLKESPQTKKLPIYGVGLSMGAATLIGAAAQGAPFEALILDSSFACMQNHLNESFSLRTGLPRFPFMTLVTRMFEWVADIIIAEYNPCDLIGNIKCPLFIVHATGDAVISVEHAYQIYEKAHKKKLLWLVDSKKHACASKFYETLYAQKANAFF